MRDGILLPSIMALLLAALASGCRPVVSPDGEPPQNLHSPWAEASDGEENIPAAYPLSHPADASEEAVPPGISAEPAARSPQAPQSEPAAVSAAAVSQQATPAPPADPFASMLAEIESLERQTEFLAALQIARQARAACKEETQVRRVEARIAGLERAQATAADLRFAVDMLGSEDSAQVDYAREILAEAGPLGAMFLRQALRHESTRLAQHAALMLLERGDSRSLTGISELVGRAVDTMAGRELLHKWVAMRGEPPPSALPAMYRVLADDQDFRHRELLGYLGSALANHCGGDEARFVDLVDNPQAAQVLRTYVDRALHHSDPAVVRWAERCVQPFGATLAGLRGQYFEGTAFDKLVCQRLDPAVGFCIPEGNSGYRADIPRRIALPFADSTPENVSARWEGFLLAPQPGAYHFYITSDDGYRLAIDGKIIGENWVTAVTSIDAVEMEVELAAGPRAFRLEWCQGAGAFLLKLEWSGPGLARQPLTVEVFRTPPFPPSAGEQESTH